jgi:Flp pilus assembly protein TadD
MLVCELCGLNPWGHHLANVLLHALNAGLVFVLLQRMTGATWRSLWVAALFAVHPLRVEAVAWVTDRKGVLSAFFGLLSLIAYARYAQGRMQNAECRMQKSAAANALHVSRFTFHVSTFYLLSLFFFVLGLMSKPMLVTLPFVMLLLDYWPLGRRQKAEGRRQKAAAAKALHAPRSSLLPLLLEKLPFLALSAIASVVTVVVQKRGGSLAMGESLSLGGRSGNALISYCRHLGKLFWPTDLAVFYPHRPWPGWEVLLAGVMITVISALVFRQRRLQPFLLVGWLWFCGILVPVIGLVQTGGQAMADRHSYLPSLGGLIAVVWGVHELTRRWRLQVKALSVVAGAVVVLLLAMTRQQIGYWKDSETLFRHALEVTENNDVAHNGVGIALGRKGQLDEAISHFQEAIRLNPNHADDYNSLGAALGKKGQLDDAVRQFQAAIRLKPDHADAHGNLGAVLYQQGKTDEAIVEFRQAIQLKPDHAEARYNLGVALDSKGQTEEAIRQYQEATRLKPNNADAHYNLGLALASIGQTDEAIRQFQEALRFKPDYADARKKLDMALANREHSSPRPGAASSP